MNVEIRGPPKPKKGYMKLDVHYEKANLYEGLFDKDFVSSMKAFFNPFAGYYEIGNKYFYDRLWAGAFESLTGENLEDCLVHWVLREEEFESRIRKIFGSEERLKQALPYKLSELHGINIDGCWIISRDENKAILLGLELHEFGHRVYPNDSDRYHLELGANYFMLLALKKINTELSYHGVNLPGIEFDFIEHISKDHKQSFEEAKKLVKNNKPYSPKDP